MLPVLAHGLGDAGDLPVSFDAVVLLSGAAVLLAAALSTRSMGGAPAVDAAADPARRPAPTVATVLRAVTLAGLLLVFALTIAGPNDPAVNPAARLAQGGFWPLLVVSAVVAGAWWPLANPLRALAALLARVAGDPADATVRSLPDRVGVWPAVALLALFAWTKAAPAPRPHTVGFVLAVIVLAVLAGSLRFGRDWVARSDPFEAYATVLGRVAPIRWDGARPRPRRPGAGLVGWAPPAGFLGLVAVSVGADLFDGVAWTLAWQNARVALAPAGRLAFDTAGFAACVALVALVTWGATRRALDLRPALVPVVAAYAVAHYLAVAPIELQVAAGQLSDPLGRGWDLFGAATVGADYDVVPGMLAALVVLGALIAGHVAAIVIAGRCAAATRRPRAARAALLPFQALVVASMLVSVLVRFGPG